ncbi:secretory carrier-associated membrane protein 3 isoform X1 [Gopherus flavomarginatus]|uniref:secretory carrier-associated membrane protein 3 isoform X1 n=1 Tax=Gopherus flavomarginatus TaxID=286002 RepID=UPI0021CBC826|nr:secretory carrier-associated membrane protein 3 isoform X1 [Gopherus flavomarginatus]
MAQNGANPFQDPAVMQHQPSTEYATLDVYNPFDNRGPPPPYQPQPGAQPTPPVTKVPQPPASAMQPPKKPSPPESKNYGSYGTQESTAAAATAELLKRQEELNRKAEELDRRERELQNAALGNAAIRQNNWPPLPSFCPMKPCFYQDIAVEIPMEFQKTVSSMYYLWMGEHLEKGTKHRDPLPELLGLPGLVQRGGRNWFALWSLYPLGSPLHTLLLPVLVQANVQSLPERQLVQLLCVLFHLLRPGYSVCAAGHRHPRLGIQVGATLGSGAGSPFSGLALCCLCRDPAVPASPSQQDLVLGKVAGCSCHDGDGAGSLCAWAALSLSHCSGWIASLTVLRKNQAAAVIMILVAVFFTVVAVSGIIMLKRIHSLYRRTGASFQKAQEEFAAGVFSNQAVRTAAVNAATGAAGSAFRAQ